MPLGTKEQPKKYNNKNCSHCMKNPVLTHFLTYENDGDVFAICPDCVEHWEKQTNGWKVEPMQPEKPVINNCAFFKHGWTPGGKHCDKSETNGWFGMGFCDGPAIGECDLSGWEPLCKHHYEFSEQKNADSEDKVNGWIKLRPLSGQAVPPEKYPSMTNIKPVIPDLVCKIKWNGQPGKSGLNCTSQGECSGEWYIATKSMVEPSLEFDYEGYKCFPVCGKHKSIFYGSKITPLSEVLGVSESPDSGQIPMQKPVITPAKAIPEFCEYCVGSKEQKPPEFKCTSKNTSLSRFLCKSCLDNSGWPHEIGATIQKMDKNIIIPSFKLSHEHQDKIENMWVCEQESDIGFDGTKAHFGECYELRKDEGSGEYACDNHAGKFVNDGYLVRSYGTNEFWSKTFKNGGKPPHIPDCLLPYIPDYTIDNCYFRVSKWEGLDWSKEGYPIGKFGVSGVCNGPRTGNMYQNTAVPLCKAHYEFCLEMNKLGNFAAVSPYTGESPLSGQKVKKTAKIPVPKPYSVRTQKARGLQALKDTYFPVPGFQIFDVKETKPDVLVGKFVRPCPMRPRHGFVDSRQVDTREDADKIIKETLAADPEAEFLLMDYVPAPFSGIWTPGYLAIGQGTDGATTGKTAITIPIMGDYLNTSSYGASARSKAGIESAPYVEILWKKKSETYEGLTVQLRDGPKLPEGAEDFIPTEFTVEHIILADGDLLEWEEKMRHTACNSVVYHPNGTMASHYAIHAVLNKVPLLITREPKIGERLKPVENGPGEVNIDLIRAGFQIACEQEISMPEAAYFMLLGCHQTTQWLGKFDILLGASMGFSYRLAMTAALGEERHYANGKGKSGRNEVYKKFWMKADTPTSRTKFLDALEKFLNGHMWPGSNYGGKAWYQFTSQAVVMYNALIRKDHKTAMEAMNQLIHAAHNSGWGFNKFISQSEMTNTAKNPIYSGFKVGPYLYEILTASNETVKSAARSFWKRKELELPVDKGTGQGKFKDQVSSHDEEDGYDDDNPCDDEDCPSCHPKPAHLFSEDCECPNCAKQKWQIGAGKPQIVTKAHVKVLINKKGNSIAHIQYKSAACSDKIPQYYTKDIPCPEPIKEMYVGLTGKYDTSYAGSDTKYLVMSVQKMDFSQIDGSHSESGWGIWDSEKIWHKLLNLEVTPNAS